MQLQGIFYFLVETNLLTMKKSFLLTVLFITLSTAFALSQSLDQGKVQAIEKLISQKLLKFDAELDKAWVSPAVWNQYNIDGKENFTTYCALYIRYKRRETNLKPSLDLYDYQSGKKIAEYSSIWGFSIED